MGYNLGKKRRKVEYLVSNQFSHTGLHIIGFTSCVDLNSTPIVIKITLKNKNNFQYGTTKSAYEKLHFQILTLKLTEYIEILKFIC